MDCVDDIGRLEDHLDMVCDRALDQFRTAISRIRKGGEDSDARAPLESAWDAAQVALCLRYIVERYPEGARSIEDLGYFMQAAAVLTQVASDGQIGDREKAEAVEEVKAFLGMG